MQKNNLIWPFKILAFICFAVAISKLPILYANLVKYRMPIAFFLKKPYYVTHGVVIPLLLTVVGVLLMNYRNWLSPQGCPHTLNKTANIIFGVAMITFFGIMIFFKWIFENDLFMVYGPIGLFMVLTAVLVYGWQKNNFQYNLASIPTAVRIGGLIGLFIMTFMISILIGNYVTQQEITPRFSHSLFVTAFFFIMAIGLIVRMFAEDGWGIKGTLTAGIISLTLGILLTILVPLLNLNELPISQINAQMKETKRCWAGTNNCYNVGKEQWGGGGATLLLLGFYFYLMTWMTFISSLTALGYNYYQKIKKENS